MGFNSPEFLEQGDSSAFEDSHRAEMEQTQEKPINTYVELSTATLLESQVGLVDMGYSTEKVCTTKKFDICA